MFLIFVRICRISLFFLDCPPRILDDFTCRLQKEPPISNSRIDRIKTSCDASKVDDWRLVLDT